MDAVPDSIAQASRAEAVSGAAKVVRLDSEGIPAPQNLLDTEVPAVERPSMGAFAQNFFDDMKGALT